MEDKLYEQSYTVKRVAGFATHAYTMPNRKHVVYGMVCGHAAWTSDISDIALRVVRGLVDPRVESGRVTKFTNISGSGRVQLS